MIELEKTVGNTNKQPRQILKPKWAENVEISRLKGNKGKGTIRPPKIVIGGTDCLFADQMPILIASYQFLK